jgi:hypothetical protein
MWGAAQRFLGDDRMGAGLAVLLLATSGQVIFTGMTAYAMPAHLFFNVVWLWLFLIDRRGTDLAALAVGFMAMGLHQSLFHPMFAGPWFLLLLWQRRWGRLALFALPYGGSSCSGCSGQRWSRCRWSWAQGPCARWGPTCSRVCSTRWAQTRKTCR